jgi:hypothetical protein
MKIRNLKSKLNELNNTKLHFILFSRNGTVDKYKEEYVPFPDDKKIYQLRLIREIDNKWVGIVTLEDYTEHDKLKLTIALKEMEEIK